MRKWILSCNIFKIQRSHAARCEVFHATCDGSSSFFTAADAGVLLWQHHKFAQTHKKETRDGEFGVATEKKRGGVSPAGESSRALMSQER